MKSKVNNSFEEEYRSINKFITSIKANLKAKKRASTITWVVLSAIIALTNIAILILSSIALNKVLEDYNNATNNIDFVKEVLPTAMVSMFSIALFIISIIISIYQGKMKSGIYKEATENIQYQFVKFEQLKEIDEKEFKTLIRKIYKSATTTKNKTSFKKSLISILTGGTDE